MALPPMRDLGSLRRRFLQNSIDVDRPLRSALRWIPWLLACATSSPQIARFRTGGLKMRLVPKLHSFGTTSIYIKRDYYEPELLAVGRLIAPDSVVLDIGGSFGIFALFMAHFAGPKGKVHCFEPGGFSYSQLTANVALNDMQDRIELHRAAASDAPGLLRLSHIGDSPVNFSIGEVAGVDAEEVPAVRIADVLPAEDAARVSFVKIDVEGYEQAALEGLRPVLEANHPTIMFEVSTGALARQHRTPADMYGYLAAYGYGFWTFEDDRFVKITDPIDGNIFASIADLSAR